MIDRASELRAIADGRLMLNVRNGVTVSRSMLAMIADEIDALRAAPTVAAQQCGREPDAYEVRCTDGNYEWRRPYRGELEVIMGTGRDRSGKPFEYRALYAAVSPLTTEPAAPEGRQDDEPRAYIVHAPEDDYYGTGPDRLQFHPLAQHDLDNGYRQTPLYGRPAEQAVTEAARRVLEWVYPIAGDNRDEAAAKEEIDSVEALKAAMEAGR